MNKYILALDQGTTSSRAIVFNENGRPVVTSQLEYPQHYPQPGWVEHDPYDILNSTLDAAKSAIAKAEITASEIAAIGITNQRETTVLWDCDTGKPIYNAIVWQCRRTAAHCTMLKADGMTDFIRERTGLLPDPYFSATKIKWLLDNVPGARDMANKGKLMFGTPDSWLLYNLTGVHATDYTNASRTMLFNINTLDWDDELLKLFDIPRSVLPKVLPSSGLFGVTKAEIFGAPMPVTGIAGDQQAALYGQGCFTEGDVKNTYGTGCFMLMNTGKRPHFTSSGLLTTLACSGNGSVSYALEGSVFVAGAAIKWLRDELCIIGTAAETEELARSIDSNGGVYMVPAFTGLGAPWWDPDARGIICGLTRGAGRAHIVRAALESIAYQSDELMRLMCDASGIQLKCLKVDGGAANNDFLMQFQADISKVNVIRPSFAESTAFGAASLAALDCGIVFKPDTSCSRFAPSMDDHVRSTMLEGWSAAVKAALK
nr:glycerol kinase GlpK [Clostridia bacterium]